MCSTVVFRRTDISLEVARRFRSVSTCIPSSKERNSCSARRSCPSSRARGFARYVSTWRRSGCGARAPSPESAAWSRAGSRSRGLPCRCRRPSAAPCAQELRSRTCGAQTARGFHPSSRWLSRVAAARPVERHARFARPTKNVCGDKRPKPRRGQKLKAFGHWKQAALSYDEAAAMRLFVSIK